MGCSGSFYQIHRFNGKTLDPEPPCAGRFKAVQSCTASDRIGCDIPHFNTNAGPSTRTCESTTRNRMARDHYGYTNAICNVGVREMGGWGGGQVARLSTGSVSSYDYEPRVSRTENSRLVFASLYRSHATTHYLDMHHNYSRL